MVPADASEEQLIRIEERRDYNNLIKEMRANFSLTILVGVSAARTSMPLSQLIQLHDQMVELLDFEQIQKPVLHAKEEHMVHKAEAHAQPHHRDAHDRELWTDHDR